MSAAEGMTSEATATQSPVTKAYFDGYAAGAAYALRLYAYSTSETWAENGVQYVGHAGETLAAALAEMNEHVESMRAAT